MVKLTHFKYNTEGKSKTISNSTWFIYNNNNIQVSTVGLRFPGGLQGGSQDVAKRKNLYKVKFVPKYLRIQKFYLWIDWFMKACICPWIIIYTSMTRLLGPTEKSQHLKTLFGKEFQCSNALLNSVYTISNSYVVASDRVLDLDR